MADDEKLAARVHRCLGDRPDVTERRMFGGLTSWFVDNSLRPSSSPLGPQHMRARWTSLAARLAASSPLARDGLSGRALERWTERAVA
jgi:hypothetical protein